MEWRPGVTIQRDPNFIRRRVVIQCPPCLQGSQFNMKNPLNPEQTRLNQDPTGRNSMGSKFNPTPAWFQNSWTLSIFDFSWNVIWSHSVVSQFKRHPGEKRATADGWPELFNNKLVLLFVFAVIFHRLCLVHICYGGHRSRTSVFLDIKILGAVSYHVFNIVRSKLFVLLRKPQTNTSANKLQQKIIRSYDCLLFCL